MNWISFELDEVYPFRIYTPNVPLRDQACLEIPFSGTVSIKYYSVEDWWIDGIETKTWNGKYGGDYESWEIDLEQFPDLKKRVEDYVLNFRREDVETAIVSDMQNRWESQQFDEGKELAKLRGTNTDV